MASVTPSEFDERFRDEFESITEPATQTVDESTDEVVLSYTIDYESIQGSAEAFEADVSEFARSVGGTAEVSGIGLDTVTIEFRFDSWTTSNKNL